MTRRAAAPRFPSLTGFLGSALALGLALSLALTSCGPSDAPRSPETAPVELVEVPEPVLDAVEPAVREQISAVAAQARDTQSAPTAEAWGLLARTYHAYDFLQAADAAYTNARRLDPDSFRWAYLQGVLREELGRNEEAAKALGDALALRPDDLTARVRRASVLRELGRVDEARRALDAVLSERDDVALAHYLLAQLEADAGDWQAAAERFERVLRLQPGASRVRYPLSRAYARLGRADDAAAQAEQSGTADVTLDDPLLAELAELERSAAALVRQGAQRQIAGDWRGAAAAYRDAVETDPEHLEARMSLGGALVELGDLEGAERQLRRAVEIDPRAALAWYNLAGVLRTEGRFDEALGAYDEAVRLSPDDVRFRLARAHTLRDAGRRAEARAAFETLSEGGSVEADFALARLDASSGRVAEAFARGESLLRRDLSEHQRRLAHLLLADVRARSARGPGGLEAALQHYGAVVDSVEGEAAADPTGLDPATRGLLADAHLGRANLLGSLGRLTEASRAYGRATEVDPSRAAAWLGGATAAALTGRWAEARGLLEEGINQVTDPDRRVDLRHTLARLLATAPVDEVRDGALALELARAALGEGGPVDYAETVGMALAELGRFDEAEAWQSRVVEQLESSGQTERAAAARALLEQYRRRQPVRQTGS